MSPIGRIRLTFLGENLYASYPAASTDKTYKGELVAVLAPQETGYHFLDLSSGKNDNFVFGQSSENGAIATAFALSFRSERLKGLPANATLVYMTRVAIEEHKRYHKEIDYTLTDEVIGTEHCKRINFYGKHHQFSPSFIFGYDIICIHPKWKQSRSPYIVRVGASYSPGWGQVKKLPKELESFYQNVSFLD